MTDRGFFSIFKSDPIIEEGIKTKYETLVKDAFLNGNTTPESAVEFAKTKLQSEYRVSTVGKPRVMQYAPEVFYDKYNNGDTSWINKQLKVEISKHTLVPSLDNLENQYILQATQETIKGKKPSYNIVNIDNYGGYSLLLDNQNQPVVFKPEIEKTDFYKEAQKEYNKERQYTKEDILNLLNDKVVAEKNKKYRNWK